MGNPVEEEKPYPFAEQPEKWKANISISCTRFPQGKSNLGEEVEIKIGTDLLNISKLFISLADKQQNQFCINRGRYELEICAGNLRMSFWAFSPKTDVFSRHAIRVGSVSIVMCRNYKSHSHINSTEQGIIKDLIKKMLSESIVLILKDYIWLCYPKYRKCPFSSVNFSVIFAGVKTNP